MPSFEINPNAKKGSERDKKIQNRSDAGGPEGEIAAKMMKKKGKGPSLPGRTADMRKVSEEEVVPGIKLVDIILGEEKCGKGMYYCYTDKKCKKLPEGMKMTARYFGGGKEPSEVGIDKPVEGGEGGDNGGNGGGNGGGVGESISIEDAFGNKFMEVVDLIKPEDIVEKCWKGYKKKGMKTMFGKRYPNCVKEEEVETIAERGPAVGGKRKPGALAARRAELDRRAAERAAANQEVKKEEVELDERSRLDGPEERKKDLDKRYDPKGGGTNPFQYKPDKKVKEEVAIDDKKDTAKLKKTAKELDAAVAMHKKQAERLRGMVDNETVDEAVRLQAEYGNLLAVVVIWRGRSLMIKMFFPQASMPKREDIQREIEKVYPGGKVTQFRRTELPSETSPHNDPIVRVQKEEAECSGTPKGKPCPVHGQKCCPSLSEEEVDEAAGEKDACYKKVKSRYSVWPSAYASGALVKCRKVGAKNWGNKSKK